MELRHLRSFLESARRGSFTRAAEELGITQAAVSQHIAALERELGVRLFDRLNRTVIVTPAGRRLEGFARQIVELHEAAHREVPGADGEVAGMLRIAASSVPGQVLLPDLLDRFRHAHPRVQESVSITDSAAATAAVERGDADVGIVGEAPHASPLVAVSIGHDELVLVVGRTHPLAGKRRLGLAQLRDVPLIFRELGSGSRDCVERALTANGVDVSRLTVQMHMNSNETIREAVERGLGAAFLSQAVVARQLQSGALVQVPLEGCRCQRDLYLIFDPRRTPSPAATAFREFVERLPRGAQRP